MSKGKYSAIRRLLWPFSVLYNGITHWRNLQFDKGKLPYKSFPLPVINVGNLSTGGTGKSPMIEYLLRLLNQKQVGVVSRGYGRMTTGLHITSENSTAKEVGDEPAQFKANFPSVPIIVSEKRVVGIEALLDQHPETEIVLLDDAYQHRYVNAGFNLLLTAYDSPFYKDLVLPAGNLRESRKGANRAQAIVVTKCPTNLKASEAADMRLAIGKYTEAPVFFSFIKYAEPLNRLGVPLQTKEIVLLTGIAKPEPLKKHLELKYKIIQHLNFADHHTFRESELQKIEQLVRNDTIPLVTTQKDYMRLLGRLSDAALDKLYVLRIETAFLLEDEANFNNMIFNYINGE